MIKTIFPSHVGKEGCFFSFLTLVCAEILNIYTDVLIDLLSAQSLMIAAFWRCVCCLTAL